MIMDEYFWVAISFLIFVIAVYKPASKFLISALDDRATNIQKELLEAANLKDESQRLLEAFQLKQDQVEQEIDELFEATEKQVKDMLEKSKISLEHAIAHRHEQAMKKIINSEQEIIRDITSAAIDKVIISVTNILANNLDAKTAKSLINDSISAVSQKPS
jgi:F-type H+-transporting ATPase subunit b